MARSVMLLFVATLVGFAAQSAQFPVEGVILPVTVDLPVKIDLTRITSFVPGQCVTLGMAVDSMDNLILSFGCLPLPYITGNAFMFYSVLNVTLDDSLNASNITTLMNVTHSHALFYGDAYVTNPLGVAVDSGGNVYLVDSGSDPAPTGCCNDARGGRASVFRIVNSTSLTDMLEPFYAGYDGGSNTLLNRYLSYGILGVRADGLRGAPVAVDAAGNLYLAHTGGNVVLKFANGVLTTLGLTANLSSPSGVAVAADGSVYVADTGNQVIKKLNNDNTSTIIASGFTQPLGVAVDKSGNIYVADSGVGLKRISGANVSTANSTWISVPRVVTVTSTGDVFVLDKWNIIVVSFSSKSRFIPLPPPPQPPPPVPPLPPPPSPPASPSPPPWTARYTCADIADLVPSQCLALAEMIAHLPGLTASSYTSVNADGSLRDTTGDYYSGVPWFSTRLACGSGSTTDHSFWTGIIGCRGSIRMVITRLIINGLQNGTFPDVSGLTTLNQLSVFANPGLRGPVPDTFAPLQSLTWLNLGGNAALTGTLPSSIGNLSSLAYFSTLNFKGSGVIADATPFSGALPSSLCNLWPNGQNAGGAVFGCYLSSTFDCPLPSCAVLSACQSLLGGQALSGVLSGPLDSPQCGARASSPPPSAAAFVSVTLLLSGYSVATFGTGEAAAFKAAVAAPIGVATSAVTVTAVVAASRRHLLQSGGVSVAFTVQTAATPASVATLLTRVTPAALQSAGLRSCTAVAVSGTPTAATTAPAATTTLPVTAPVMPAAQSSSAGRVLPATAQVIAVAMCVTAAHVAHNM